MCMTDGEDPDFISSSALKARKQHRCGECGRAIEAGETYERTAGCWDGAVSTHKTCAHCVVAATWLLDECRGFLFRGVKADIHDHLKEAPPGAYPGLARIYIGMRRKWSRFGGGLMPIPAQPANTPQSQRH